MREVPHLGCSAVSHRVARSLGSPTRVRDRGTADTARKNRMRTLTFEGCAWVCSVREREMCDVFVRHGVLDRLGAIMRESQRSVRHAAKMDKTHDFTPEGDAAAASDPNCHICHVSATPRGDGVTAPNKVHTNHL